MPKKFSEVQKKEMVNSFINGKTIDELSSLFEFSKITITRNLKIMVGESEYKKLLKNNRKQTTKEDKDEKKLSKSVVKQEIRNDKNTDQKRSPENLFIEIAPLDSEIPIPLQKDFASIPIADINFPKIVYMIVDKNIELETKLLNSYPEWQFLSPKELNRKTIEIFLDLKIAKRFCSKEQKVIKVPNPNVLKTVSSILVARGISRIISADQLIAL